VIRFGVPVSIAVAAVLAGVRPRRSAFGESLVGAALGLLLVSLVRAQSQPLELG
jgi:hypothetical protein